MPKIDFRLSDEEKEVIVQNAKNAGMTTSAYCKACALEKNINPIKMPLPKTDLETVIQLSKIGGLLKQLWKQGRGANREVYEELHATIKYIRGR